MTTTKVAITVDSELLAELDKLVREQVFPNRSKAFQEAMADTLTRRRRRRLAEECAKLDAVAEQKLAEEGMVEELDAWPAY
ncbi:MAG: ribbon-helix-helix domain-containing protein [Chloroflexaceae bacterium]|jgi:metal-responsive CopG/Arc/MetJ family transcriptional regulator|nr:ribbon-helix-helix domain-containing protein [Chloroflexaceae bacterium]